MKVVTLADYLEREWFADVVEPMADVEFDRCPLAYTGGGPQCLAPRQMPWLGRARQAARVVSAGMSVRDIEPTPTEALVEGVAALIAESESAAMYLARMRE